MDLLLFSILLFFTVKGTIKGFVSTIIAFVGTAFIAVLAWNLCPLLANLLQNWLNLDTAIKNIIDSKIPGTFSSMEELKAAISEFGLFYSILFGLAGNIYFEGEQTAGQILAPSLNVFACKIISFVIIFVALAIVLKILKFLLSKLIKVLGLSFGNRILGGIVGLAEGVVIFGVIFFVISMIANALLNETLLAFVESGNVSRWLYDNIIIKIIKLIF